MAASPRFKVYNPEGDYIAACKHAEDAAALVALYGAGATIRLDHTRVMWREGAEVREAGESYDFVAQTVADRCATAIAPRKMRLRFWTGPVGADEIAARLAAANIPGVSDVLAGTEHVRFTWVDTSGWGAIGADAAIAPTVGFPPESRPLR